MSKQQRERVTRWWVALVLAWGLVGPILAPLPAAAQVGAWPEITLTPVIQGLTSPVYLSHAGDGSGRIFVVEKPGRIVIWQDGALLPTAFLDIQERVRDTGSEQGLFGVAFPPAYADKGYFYVNYTDNNGDTVVSRFHLGSDPNVADPNSEELVLTQGQPYANHNGGQLAFGPDGYLYIGMGDGGSGGDPQNRAQDPGTLLGKMLRIDVESGQAPYSVPADNPFAGREGYLDEIWALGLRNPWRFSFDREAGDLYIGDVGQNAYEEMDFQPAGSSGGANYGWNILEGDHCFRPPSGCEPPPNYVPPIQEHAQTSGWNSITGGYVYRGTAHPELRGIYFYGNFGDGQIWGLRQVNGTWQAHRFLTTGWGLSSFGEDEAGRIYALRYGAGTALEIRGVLPTPTPTAPATATATDTGTPSATATDTATPSATPTPTDTATFTPTETHTGMPHPTITSTVTPSPTGTATVTPTETHTGMPHPTITSTVTPSPTNTATSTAVAATWSYKIPLILKNWPGG